MRDCHHQWKNPKSLHNLDNAAMVEEMARETPRIYAMLEEQQEDHHSTVIKVEGMIAHQYVSFLIDPRSAHSYVAPQIVEK